MNYEVKSIDHYECKEWLLYKHYAKRLPSISYSFGLFDQNILIGICTIGKPPSPPLCIGVCGQSESEYVYELNRLVVNEDLPKNSLSYFVSRVLKLLPSMILVSYADTSQHHHGYIYQATNWIYTGLSDKRTEWRLIGSNKHSKSICDSYSIEEMKNDDRFEMVERPRKHRYIYFIGNKRQVKKWKSMLNYKIEPYPKGDNMRYDASFEPIIQTKLF